MVSIYVVVSNTSIHVRLTNNYPRVCARGKVIGRVIVVVVVVVVVIVVVVSTKITKSKKLALDRVLYVIKQSKITKNYHLFASNRLEQPMSTSNRAFSPATPIDHTYQCHVVFPLCMLDLKIGKGRRVTSQ